MQQNTVASLILTTPPPLTEHPASVYLGSLAPGSEPTMKRSLSLIAELLTNGQADYLTLDWASLRYKHTAAIRGALIKNYEPATVNRVLCALRQVLKEALRLELMSPVDYARAVDIQSVKARKELRGRALSQDEIDALMTVCFADTTPADRRFIQYKMLFYRMVKFSSSIPFPPHTHGVTVTRPTDKFFGA